ncbi:right-handed parallel beta-helix repeat-containing protein [Arachidicoccus sp.]|uniref:right-handed parallel beta-helix repeat-containing protein n=1 Tax=Arachidicoccus sp. TaxID=1872624 RepID=UPI003D246B9A
MENRLSKKQIPTGCKRLMLVALLVCIVSWMPANGLANICTSKPKDNTGKNHTYEVSVNGNDGNAGTKASPLKTISAAAALALPGDTVLVHAGVYREQISPPRGGNSNAERIVYQAAPGEKVVIKGSEVIKGWKKSENDTWEVKIPNTFFGDFNPYKELIHGDWFWPTPKDQKYHRGAVYLNGDWLMEASKKEAVMAATDKKNPLWWAEVDSTTTTIWAQFKDADPNKDLVEINVRPTVFYPDKPFINFITVQGFTMEQAATNWAPPTAEQVGIIGTHWSRGWIIENNTIEYSKCSGIALGKYGDQFDNKNTESAEGYVGTIKRALAFGWNKGTIGGHIVRGNTIAYCEQTGIVGSLGCSFSTIEANSIHDIYVHRLFNGAEMAGIKFHGAIDVQIKHNHIYRVGGFAGIWLDWMAQGVQLCDNLMNDNSLDIFLEVDHGPMLIANNILLSKSNIYMNSQGAAFAHNLFAGKIDVIHYDARLTPYMKPHSTYVVALHDNPSGDVQFVNNLFVNGADVRPYSNALLPVTFKGNVYTKGALSAIKNNGQDKFGEMNKDAERQMKAYEEHVATKINALVDSDFDAGVNLLQEGKNIYLQIAIDKKWLALKHKLVTTRTLTKAIVSDLPFENPDGSALHIDMDYLGKKRNSANPSVGPFEIKSSGKQNIKVW